MNWVTIDALGEHWAQARVRARLVGDAAGRGRHDRERRRPDARLPARLRPVPDSSDAGQRRRSTARRSTARGRSSDRSWQRSLRHDGRATGRSATAAGDGLRKRHDLQGPIDDAFMDSFVFVRPTGKSPHAEVRRTGPSRRWPARSSTGGGTSGARPGSRTTRRSTTPTSPSSNLVLWGDPESNAVLKRIADKLPIALGRRPDQGRRPRRSTPTNHALILIYPNPLNPTRYVVLNSGFTFREYDYLNNARQVPKLPDWAVIDLRTPPDSRYPGKVVAADFFGEDWELQARATMSRDLTMTRRGRIRGRSADPSRVRRLETATVDRVPSAVELRQRPGAVAEAGRRGADPVEHREVEVVQRRVARRT